MTVDLISGSVDTASPLRRHTGGDEAGTDRPNAQRPAALALGALLTAVKVALACIAILVVLPAAMAAQTVAR